MRRKYKIVNGKRFFIFSTIFSILIILFIVSIIFRNTAHSTEYEAKYLEVIVEEGDTLWNIVTKYIPTTKNKQKTVFEINKLNNIGNNHIFPGDIIKIPIKK